MGHVFGFVSGLVFGIGLILAGMANPMKVKAFLDLAGAWDPSLALVMGGAIALGVVVFWRARLRSRSWSGAPMEIPSSTTIDGRLVLGGVGTGVAVCVGCGVAVLAAMVVVGAGVAVCGISDGSGADCTDETNTIVRYTRMVFNRSIAAPPSP